MLTLARRHALFYFARGLCGHFLKLLACCFLVAKNHSVCACACVSLVNCACVRVCGSTCVCSRCSMTPSAGALHLVQAHVSFSLPPRLFANIDHASRAHASKSRRITHLSSRAWWSRPRCSCPDLAGHLTRRAPVLRAPGSSTRTSYPLTVRPHLLVRKNPAAEPPAEGTGTLPDYLVNRVPKKLRGHPGKKIAQKSRNNCTVNGQGCSCIGTVDLGPKYAQFWN